MSSARFSRRWMMLGRAGGTRRRVRRCAPSSARSEDRPGDARQYQGLVAVAHHHSRRGGAQQTIEVVSRRWNVSSMLPYRSRTTGAEARDSAIGIHVYRVLQEALEQHRASFGVAGLECRASSLAPRLRWRIMAGVGDEDRRQGWAGRVRERGAGWRLDRIRRPAKGNHCAPSSAAGPLYYETR